MKRRTRPLNLGGDTATLMTSRVAGWRVAGHARSVKGRGRLRRLGADALPLSRRQARALRGEAGEVYRLLTRRLVKIAVRGGRARARRGGDRGGGQRAPERGARGAGATLTDRARASTVLPCSRRLRAEPVSAIYRQL